MRSIIAATTLPLRIAIADDEDDIQSYYRRIIPHLGHQVVSVSGDGERLVEAVRIHSPELVITDLQMPRLDGIDAAQQIVQIVRIPIILVSGNSEPETIDRALAAPVSYFLIKPVDLAQLRVAISFAFKRFVLSEAKKE